MIKQFLHISVLALQTAWWFCENSNRHLVHRFLDAFIQKMPNKTVQKRLCTEPKGQPQEALRFTNEIEELSRQKSFGGSSEIKAEQVLAVEGRTSRNTCTRCGFEFSQNHQAVCKTKTEICRNCRVSAHFLERLSSQKWKNRLTKCQHRSGFQVADYCHFEE